MQDSKYISMRLAKRIWGLFVIPADHARLADEQLEERRQPSED